MIQYGVFKKESQMNWFNWVWILNDLRCQKKNSHPTRVFYLTIVQQNNYPAEVNPKIATACDLVDKAAYYWVLYDLLSTSIHLHWLCIHPADSSGILCHFSLSYNNLLLSPESPCPTLAIGWLLLVRAQYFNLVWVNVLLHGKGVGTNTGVLHKKLRDILQVEHPLVDI